MSKIEVNEIDKTTGSTLTLGGSGTAVTLASGATQSGFGREGSVDWQTGSIKTTTFTAADGEGYFINTTSGGVTVNLPAGSAGAIVAFADYTRTFGTNAVTIVPNGSNKIGGVAENASLSVSGQSATFVFVDSTEGWINVQETQTSQTGVSFIAATGGTVTTCGNDKIHTFTGPGTFCVSSVGSSADNNILSYVIVAGGGGGGSFHGGGGGAGGYREVKSPATPGYTASPLDGFSVSGNRISASVSAIPITVGAGGVGTKGPSAPGGPVSSTAGSNSVVSTITSAGGGRGGGSAPSANEIGGNGGSGGGGQNGTSGNTNGPAGGSGNTPSVSPPQGQDGGKAGSDDASFRGGGGGGGAGGGGTDVTPSGPSTNPVSVGNGGAGVTSEINASPVQRAGGGGAGSTSVIGTAGAGGGGQGGTNACNVAAAGTVNTGGGGGGAGNPDSFEGKAGGSGIVIIRYKFQ